MITCQVKGGHIGGKHSIWSIHDTLIYLAMCFCLLRVGLPMFIHFSWSFMSFTFLKQQSDSMNEELVTNKLAPFDFKQLRRYTVLHHYNIIYSFIYRERESLSNVCIHMCRVRDLFPSTFPQTCTAGEYSRWTSASGSSLGRRNMLG